MPKDPSIQSVLVIGAGPIVIGQACEFDYSGVQACLALKQEKCRVILINPNPATIMTDPGIADATYLEPITTDSIEKIIIQERPDAILPIVGGQTALNCCVALIEQHILAKHQVKMIGVSYETIIKAENREYFKQAAQEANLETPKAMIAYDLKQAQLAKDQLGLPLMIRTSFTLGGQGSSIVYQAEDFIHHCQRAFATHATHGILIEECVAGWKEYELEIMQDSAQNNIVICSIENIDPMGVHTGDSITVAPAQTLTDKEYQIMRRAAFSMAREIGLTTGGCNVQFAVHPLTGRLLVIEINPRVSRSSALASKATGFPIAKIAAKLALGFTLDELNNTATEQPISAAFEPTLDYVVTKIPRFQFEKFPGCSTTLSPEMKSVGEVMAIGRNFQESLQKALCSLEIGSMGFDRYQTESREDILQQLQIPCPERLWLIAEALRHKISMKEIYQITRIDAWFLQQISELVKIEETIKTMDVSKLQKHQLYRWKQQGFSDARLGQLMGVDETAIRAVRHQHNIRPVYKCVDTCAGEFRAATHYFYSTYEQYSELPHSTRQKIIIIGSGPNRIGQGIEFDYCCVHAAKVLRELGYESIIINCNPETVSTDYDISDRLFFEPLIAEHILEIIAAEKPEGVLVQFGGQTPLHLAKTLEAAGISLLGSVADCIDIAEDRKKFKALLHQLNLQQPLNTTFSTPSEALQGAETIGYPCVIRPSYVLGGQAVALIKDEMALLNYLKHHTDTTPALIEQFLENALEVEVDAISDGTDIFIGGITEQLEMAGIHSGDSSCCLPPVSLTPALQNQIIAQTRLLAQTLKIVGCVNIQFAIHQENIFVLEMNPRASRTLPFICKATGVPLIDIAIHCLLGKKLATLALDTFKKPEHFSVKMPIFPFHKFTGCSTVLGMEMKSTGEVMGMGLSLAAAISKAESSAKINTKIKTRWHQASDLLTEDPVCLQTLLAFNLQQAEKIR